MRYYQISFNIIRYLILRLWNIDIFVILKLLDIAILEYYRIRTKNIDKLIYQDTKYQNVKILESAILKFWNTEVLKYPNIDILDY